MFRGGLRADADLVLHRPVHHCDARRVGLRIGHYVRGVIWPGVARHKAGVSWVRHYTLAAASACDQTAVSCLYILTSSSSSRREVVSESIRRMHKHSNAIRTKRNLKMR